MMGPALLVFCDETEIAWLRWLRPGFRHVFLALPVSGGWVTLDPLSTCLEVAFHPIPSGTDLAAWFRTQGHVVLPVPVRPPLPAQWPLAPFTCVTVAKRVLGIHAPWVQTPWQLYRHLGGDPPAPNQRTECPILARLVSSRKPTTATGGTAIATAAATPAAATGLTPTTSTAATIVSPQTAGEASLLRRATGRAGTVLTGWRGVLAPGALAPVRKTLLGE